MAREITEAQRALRWARHSGAPPIDLGVQALGGRLAWARLRAGYSFKRVAAALECSAGAVRLWEKKGTLPLQLADKTAKVLNVRAEWLVFGLGTPEAADPTKGEVTK